VKSQDRLVPTFESRAQTLAERRNAKMASSAHAYVRGSTVQFYKWLADGGERVVPKGPPVWICGDCHVGNLGPLADAKGKIHIQIRDLDQTVIGNPNHDLIRLALSLFSAARGSDLPGVTTAHMLESMMDGYERALAGTRAPAGSEKPECVKVVMRQAEKRTWKHLARERLRDLKPNIPEVVEEVRGLFERYEQALIDKNVDVLDATFWQSPHTIRYAMHENGYGFAEIHAHRVARPPGPGINQQRRTDLDDDASCGRQRCG